MITSFSFLARTPRDATPLHPRVAALRPSTRLWELDAMRGLMLVLMLSTHLPTTFGIPTSQPFGYVSAAEVFVTLSAYMVGRFHTQRYLGEGWRVMCRAVMRRALVIYSCQVMLLLFAFVLLSALERTLVQPATQEGMGFYLQQPVTALFSSLALVYAPPFLDVLPIYVIFMLLSPWVLSYGLRRGWRNIMVVSALLWLATQFGLSAFLYKGFVAVTGVPVPYKETGFFEVFAWQVLWLFGLWLGAKHAVTPPLPQAQRSRVLAGSVILISLAFLVWRHMSGLNAFSFGHPLNALFYKWRLGPLRLLNFFVIVLLVMSFREALKKYLPRIRWLERLGQASLPVFCVQTVIVFLAYCFIGLPTPDRPLWKDGVLFGVSLLVLYGVAWWVERNKRFSKHARERRSPFFSFLSTLR